MLRRGLTTVVLVVGFAALVGAAIVDVFRSGGEARTQQDGSGPAAQDMPTVGEELLDAGVAGTIYVADVGCRVRGMHLPRLAEVPGGARPTPACSFAVTARGQVLEGDGWYPPRLTRAVTEGDLVELTSPAGWVLRVEGAAPSWRPDGTLTVARGAEVRAVDESCSENRGDCTRVLLRERDLRASAPELGDSASVAVREIGWLDERRVALVLSIGHGDSAPESVLGIWEGTRLVRALRGGGAAFSDLRPSPRGGFVTARVSDRPDNLLILDRDGREVSPADLAGDRLGRPRFRFVRALALSRNERLVAIASRRGVYIFRRGGLGKPKVVRLRLNALDLVWH